MRAWMTSLGVLGALLVVGGCSDDDSTPTCDNAADGTCPAGCPMDPDCADVDAGPPVDGGEMTMDNGIAYDEIYDESCVATPNCRATEIETACACPRLPQEAPPANPNLFDINRVGCGQLEAGGEGVRTPEDDFCDGAAEDGAPALSCFMPGMYREAPASESITFYGVVDVFGNGGDADQITVEIYEEGADGALGDLLGSATATTEHPCTEQEDEIDNDMVVGTRQLGFYAIENIPTETPLIVKTSGNRDFWRDIYTYNIVAATDELEEGDFATESDECNTEANGDSRFDGVGRYDYRARILSSSDWTSIPLTAGLVEGVRPTSGAVAGEVHDCDDVRLEFAQVATNPPPEVLAYFNDNPDNPLPATSRSEGTSLLGLYAALDIPEGPVEVTAIGKYGDDLVSLGWYRARIFAGSVTSVTLRGIRAHQVPADE